LTRSDKPEDSFLIKPL